MSAETWWDEELHRYMKECEVAWIPLGKEDLSVREVLTSHYGIARYFAEEVKERGLSQVGPKDAGLLQSTVARQMAGFGGKRFWSNKYQVMATLYFGIAKNHVFHDANKRTASVCLLHHIEKSSLSVRFDQGELEELALRTAAGNLVEYHRFGRFVRQDHAEVHFIADWIRRNTGQKDHVSHRLSYRELNTLLGSYGYYLDDPNDNKISVYRREAQSVTGVVRTLLGKRRDKCVGRISFPGWSREVPKGELRYIRKLLKLDEEHGVDNARFFEGFATLEALLPQYHSLMLRLAKK